MATNWDAVVIGAGFGGLGAALHLAERGARVLVAEAVTYPGGCASTFSRRGFRFEAGATLFSGFAEGQLFRTWIDRHRIPVTIDWLDPVVELRSADIQLEVPRHRDELVRRFTALPGAPVDALERFFALQGRIADLVWGLLDDPGRLPPFDGAGLLAHAARAPRYLGLLRYAGRPLVDVLRRFGLQDFAPLRTFLDAVCQITIQCDAATAEAPFALATLDYFFRGTGHVRGGIGELARGLVGAIERLGGEVRFADAARSVEAAADGTWRVRTRRGTEVARTVVANLLPQALDGLLDDATRARANLAQLGAAVEDGWGACMLYLAARAPHQAGGAPHHLEIVQDTAQPFIEGNHVFASISGREDVGRAPDGLRTITVSTHVPMKSFLARDDAERGAHVAMVHERMRQALATWAPEWWSGVEHELTASPRTFERFTGRPSGYVGGVPRRAGWHNYRRIGPQRIRPGLYLVGDSVFPGQSTLATALSGVKAADTILRCRKRRRAG